MRLKDTTIHTIRKYATKYFGKDSEVYLFGSRVDDHSKGGDIDLLIKTNIPLNEHLNKKLDFLTKLNITLGFQKIDVIVQPMNAKNKREIVRIAENKGERIC